jgi:alpha-mannosidase
MAYSRRLAALTVLLAGIAIFSSRGNSDELTSAPPAPASPKTVYFTFGNHMHWIDMTWNWGEQVLPSSAEDMMRLIDVTGARGNLNFDAVGYEKMAEQAPAVLARLKDYVRRGQLEVVGASYGQPYGLFLEGESNVRQRVYGVRTVQRLFGNRPHSWWEEEFDFFPQLPQILNLTGFRSACLFFQWTWHTPFVPFEKDEVIEWEGVDGSRLRTVPRTKLQIHQWPERWAEVLERPEIKSEKRPLIVQWLELMPSKDWMCRSELIAPELIKLSKRPDLKLMPVTLSQYVALSNHARLRHVRYKQDDVFHGMSIGKNGDVVRRTNRQTEFSILSAETFALAAGTLGRPYAQWDVYPSWDLEEAWRDLMIGEGHDVDECEALCGTVGKSYMRQAETLAKNVLENNLRHMARHVSFPSAGQNVGQLLVAFNPLGHARRDLVSLPLKMEGPVELTTDDGRVVLSQVLHNHDGSRTLALLAEDVPSVGYRAYRLRAATQTNSKFSGQVASLRASAKELVLDDGIIRATIDRHRGTVTSIARRGDSEDYVDPSRPLLEFTARVGGKMRTSTEGIETVEAVEQGPLISSAVIRGHLAEGIRYETEVRVIAGLGRLEVHPRFFLDQRLDPTLAQSLQHRVAPRLDSPRTYADYPFAVEPVEPHGVFQKKYPTGDWMTSKQFFEEIKAPFTGLNLVDQEDGRRGLLLVHDGNEGFFADPSGYRQVLSMYDAWDESYWERSQTMALAFIPHAPYANHDRLNAALDFNRPLLAVLTDEGGEKPELPATGSFLSLAAPSVVLSAFYREADGSPTLRCFEVDGKPALVDVSSQGEIASASKVNLLGDQIERLAPSRDSVRVSLRPHEIITLRLDLVKVRKQWRNLDSSREVWVKSGEKEKSKPSQ